jgi:hypothetical protein
MSMTCDHRGVTVSAASRSPRRRGYGSAAVASLISGTNGTADRAVADRTRASGAIARAYAGLSVSSRLCPRMAPAGRQIVARPMAPATADV